MICKELVNYQDELYFISNKVKETQIKVDNVNELKELWGCDIVLKQKNPIGEMYLLFLNKIQDVEIIEESVIGS
jgi:hypothetical protein